MTKNPYTRWGTLNLISKAQKYDSILECQKDNPDLVRVLFDRAVQKEAFGHCSDFVPASEPTPHRLRKWDRTRILENAARYDSISDIRSNGRKAYDAARRMNMLPELRVMYDQNIRKQRKDAGVSQGPRGAVAAPTPSNAPAPEADLFTSMPPVAETRTRFAESPFQKAIAAAVRDTTLDSVSTLRADLSSLSDVVHIPADVTAKLDAFITDIKNLPV